MQWQEGKAVGKHLRQTGSNASHSEIERFLTARHPAIAHSTVTRHTPPNASP
ncbi:Hypothetical protein SMAX5B_005408 [Scophthalmus maximus]|uniref:Uncharacterized protein n=1 Tax=Scophthalmus maximus TaxID=52904 RepID=A0A2U9B1T1_SCOMX|nr:Hypothetical protein SMAX5B_005408 [Scophthalmus maximus]